MSRIVVAEDDAHILRVISLWLTRQGHEVLEAPNGARALELIDAQRPDILVTDVNMPELDGLSLLKALANHTHPPRGIVMLTNRWDHREIGEQVANAEVQVIPKPFSPTRLAEMIERMSVGAAAPAHYAADEGD